MRELQQTTNKNSGEVKLNLFMLMADGLATNLLLQNERVNRAQALKAWNTIFALINNTQKYVDTK